MSFFTLALYSLKFMVPSLFSITFRAVALGSKGKKRTILGLLVYIAYVLIVPSILISVMGYGAYTHIAFYIMLPANLAVLIFSTDPPVKTMFMQFMQSAAVTAISSIIAMTQHLLGYTYFTLLIITTICYAIVFVIALKFFAKPIRFLLDNISSGIIGLLAMPIAVMMISNVIVIYPEENFANHPVFCTMITLSIQAVLFLYISSLYANLKKIKALTEEKSEQQILTLSLHALEERTALFEDATNMAREREHDRRHFNRTLQTLLSEGNTAQAMEILSKNEGPISDGIRTYCENTVLNASICYYATIMEQQGIAFSPQLDIPQSIAVDNLRLTMVVSNLLENAINACCKLAEGKARYISFTAVCKNQLILEMENSYTGEILWSDTHTPKSDEMGHGVGTESILSFVAEQGGQVIYEGENGVFRVQIIL